MVKISLTYWPEMDTSSSHHLSPHTLLSSYHSIKLISITLHEDKKNYLMFLTDVNVGDIASLSTRLCSQAELLRTR